MQNKSAADQKNTIYVGQSWPLYQAGSLKEDIRANEIGLYRWLRTERRLADSLLYLLDIWRDP